MSESKKKKENNELETKEEMKATGKGTGKTALLSFQCNGKFHEKGKEVLGVDEKTMKELIEKKLVE